MCLECKLGSSKAILLVMLYFRKPFVLDYWFVGLSNDWSLTAGTLLTQHARTSIACYIIANNVIGMIFDQDEMLVGY